MTPARQSLRVAWAQLMVVVEMEIDQHHINQVWCLMPVNPALGRQKQKSILLYSEFKASMDYVRSCL